MIELNKKRLQELADGGRFVMPGSPGETKFLAHCLAWQPIETAPTEGIFDVMGSSGYNPPHDTYIERVYRNPSFRGDRFLTMSSDDLFDYWPTPTHWRPST